MSSPLPEAPSTDRPCLAIATVGHEGDGKTTLAAALMKAQGIAQPLSMLDPDRAHRGFTGTITPNRVAYQTSQRAITHLDSSGKRPWLKNVARTLVAADAAVLVVSAEHGMRPQSHEHLLAAVALGLELVVFINKCDLIEDEELLDVVESEARGAMNEAGLDGDSIRVIRGAAKPALEGQALWQSGIAALVFALDTHLRLPDRPEEAPAILLIDRVYSRHPGRPGPLVEGRLLQGRLAQDDRVERIGLEPPEQGQIISLEVHHQRVREARAGAQVGVILRGKALERTGLRSGQALIHPGAAQGVTRFEAKVRVLERARGGRHTPIIEGYQCHLLIGAAAVLATFAPQTPHRDIEPGKEARVRVTLARPVFVQEGLRFIFRDGTDGFALARKTKPSWGGTAGWGVALSPTRSPTRSSTRASTSASGDSP